MIKMFHECRKTLKIAVLGQVLALLLSASAVPAVTAAAEPPQYSGIETVGLTLDGETYSGRAVLYRDTTYVELGEFAGAAGACSVSRDAENRSAFCVGEGIEICVQNGMQYIEANGRYLWCENGVFVQNEGVYVPLRAAAKALGAGVYWDADTFSAAVVREGPPISSGESFYSPEELLWLSRIIYAEAGVEPFLGQIAVGNVVLNRVRNEQFPNTIYAVIFDRKNGVQFSPTANGTVYCTPDEEAIIAAKICLEGYSLSHEILYFLNAALSTNFWVPQNRPYVMTISGHDFYS